MLKYMNHLLKLVSRSNQQRCSRPAIQCEFLHVFVHGWRGVLGRRRQEEEREKKTDDGLGRNSPMKEEGAASRGADPAPQALSFASLSSSADPSSPYQLHSSPAPDVVPQIESLPLFRDVPVLERQALFLHNRICSVLFDFSDTLKSAREKEVKRQTLKSSSDCVFIRSTQCDVYGQEKNYSERVMLIYDGLHYDELAMSPYDGAPEGFDQTIFSVRSDHSIGPVENFALNLVKDAQK
ncbi:hypothetical protein ZIOFF_050409 [Zingiber officinale]|uniref:Ubiquitin thioesterase OTU n=1 Tax=Zingiber officinale TaxID=94328 RepID=A0A8J5FKB4_ZINOF|nr:hypothetical protein ZIOFF_050409 [Zingiber officinale]